MDRYARLTALLDRIAKWGAAYFAIGCGGLLALNAIYRVSPPPDAPLYALIVSALAIVPAGFVSLSAFALRGAIEGRWRYSIAGLLIATTLVAVGLGLAVWMAR